MTSTTPRSVKQSPPSGLAQALIAASVHFGSLERDAENPYHKSKYLSLSALLQAVRPALSDAGVLIHSCYKVLGGSFVVETTLCHAASGEQISSSFPVLDPSPQKAGSAGTYGLRYNLMQLLAIAPADDDGNSAAGLMDTPAEFTPPQPQQTVGTFAPGGNPFI
jgi:hypothetical protein